MKTVAFELLNRKFDDQYTFDLQGYLTFQEFNGHMKTLNRSIKQASLPRHLNFWVKLLWMIWVASACLFYAAYMHDLPLWIVILLSLVLLLSTFSFIYYYYYRISKFENSALEACEKLNGTEEPRGIEYLLMKNNQACRSARLTFSWGFLFGAQPTYEMVIRFDDRYDQRYSKEFISVPLYPAMPAAILAENKRSNDTDTPYYDDKSNDIKTPFLSNLDKKSNDGSMV